MPAKIDLPSRPRPQPAFECIISVPTQHTDAADVSTRSLGRGERSFTFVPPDTTTIVVCSTSCVISVMFSRRSSPRPREEHYGPMPSPPSPTTGATVPRAFSYIRQTHLEGSICMRGHCMSWGRINSAILGCPSCRWHSMHDRTGGRIVPTTHVCEV